MLAEKTNLYALQNGRNFPTLTTSETRVFLGLQLAVGTLKYPRLRMHWEEKYRIPMFDQMSRNRFFSIRNNLEIPNNNTDRFIKVRPVFDAIRNRCQQIPVEEYVSIDEQMVPFTGKLDVKQYVKGKPTPYGIKIYCLCGKSGILYDFIIYQGSSTEFNPDFLSKFGQLPTVVL